MDSSHTLHKDKNSILSVKTLGICLAIVVGAFIALTVYKVPISTLLFGGALLICPLLHIMMMKDGDHKH